VGLNVNCYILLRAAPPFLFLGDIMDLSHLDTTELLQLMFAEGGPDMISEYATADQITDLESLMMDHYAEKHAGGEHLVHWEASEYVH
jgi:hypothetical protein